MASIILDPVADGDQLRGLQAELAKAIVGRGRARAIDVEFGSDARPTHAALQLLASVALTAPATGRRVTFGPRAAAEVARMDVTAEARQ